MIDITLWTDWSLWREQHYAALAITLIYGALLAVIVVLFRRRIARAQ